MEGSLYRTAFVAIERSNWFQTKRLLLDFIPIRTRNLVVVSSVIPMAFQRLNC